LQGTPAAAIAVAAIALSSRRQKASCPCRVPGTLTQVPKKRRRNKSTSFLPASSPASGLVSATTRLSSRCCRVCCGSAELSRCGRRAASTLVARTKPFDDLLARCQKKSPRQGGSSKPAELVSVPCCLYDTLRWSCQSLRPRATPSRPTIPGQRIAVCSPIEKGPSTSTIRRPKARATPTKVKARPSIASSLECVLNSGMFGVSIGCGDSG